MVNRLKRVLTLTYFSIKQNYSIPLKIYSVFSLSWCTFWTIVWTWFLSYYVIHGENIGIYFIVWCIFELMFCGPVYPFQVLWARRIERLAKEANYWSKQYEIKAQQQQQIKTNEEREKQKLWSLIQYNYQKEMELKVAQSSQIKTQQQLEQIKKDALMERQKREAAESEIVTLKTQFEQIVEREKEAKVIRINNIQMAKNFELALRYEDAAKIYEEYGMWHEAGQTRMKAIELHAPKSLFKAHNIQIGDSTIVQDSVINRSEIGLK